MYKDRKVIHVCPTYANADMFNDSRTYLKDKLTPGLIDEFWCLGNKYPLPSVKENDDKLREYCKIHDYNYFDSDYDRGHVPSINNFFAYNPQPKGTILIGFDSDSKTPCIGYDKALIEVMVEGGLVITSLWNLGMVVNSSKRWPIESCKTIIAGYNVYMHPAIEMMNISAICLDFINRVGGFQQPMKYYGGIETSLYNQMQSINAPRIGFLIDYYETYDPYPNNNSPYLRNWKDDHLAGNKDNFEEWLRKRNFL